MRQLLAFTLVLFLVLSGSIGHAQNLKNMHDQAIECFRAKNYKCAERKLKKLIKKEEDQLKVAQYYSDLGTTQRRMGKRKEALKSYNSAIEINSGNAVFFTNRGTLQRQLGNFDGAMTDLSLAIELDSLNESAFLNRSDLYESLGDIENAKKDLETIMKNDPSAYRAASNYTILIKKEGRFEEAIEIYNRLIRENSDVSTIEVFYNNRADTWLKLKNYDRAMEDVNQALLIEPEYAGAHVSKGEILLELGRIEEACDQFNRALELGLNRSIIETLLLKCD